MDKQKNWIQNLYYLCTLGTLIFIMAQAYYAKCSIDQSREWEKAKITIENIEKFKENLKSIPIPDKELWELGDRIWADFSTSKGFELSDSIRYFLYYFFNNFDEAKNNFVQMIDIMDAFAYPIIMGYASEFGSYQSVVRQYYMYSSFIMPEAFHTYKNIGHNSKLLYRLWRIRYEIMTIDNLLAEYANNSFDPLFIKERFDHLLCFDGTKEDIYESSLKAYRKKLDKKLKEMQKEIEVFRKNSLK